jgi:hypothetical protein
LWKIRDNLWKRQNYRVETLGNLWGKLRRKIRIANKLAGYRNWGVTARWELEPGNMNDEEKVLVIADSLLGAEVLPKELSAA